MFSFFFNYLKNDKVLVLVSMYFIFVATKQLHTEYYIVTLTFDFCHHIKIKFSQDWGK